MAKTTAQIQDLDITITQGTAGRLKGVFAGIGNTAGIIVGGTGGGAGGQGSGPGILIAGAGEDGGDEIAFDSMLDEVRPGDLITSDFMMRLLARVNQLEAAVLKLAEGGDVVVPDLFGQTLTKVAEAVGNSGGKLAFGLVLDVIAQEIDPTEDDEGPRLVLAQYPAPGDEVDEGTELNLLVSFLNRGVQAERMVAGDVVGASSFRGPAVRAEPAAGGPSSGELQRVTDEPARPGAGTKSGARGASKSRRTAAK